MRVGEAVELVDDEEAKDHKRRRIGPEFVSDQTDDQEHLDDAVAEKVEGIEVLGAEGKTLRQGREMCSDKVIGILDQFILGERVNQASYRAGADEGQHQAADALD